ncbi:MAG: alanine racemase [Candidatus Bipolaricaulota bacterium]
MIRAEIDTRVLQENFERLRARIPPSCSLMAVVKEDAYGHGLLKTARAGADLVDWFGVAGVAEGKALRRAGLSQEVFVMLPPVGQALREAIGEGFHIPAGDLHMLEELPRAARLAGRPARVHLEIDTGMGRFGLLSGEAEAALERLAGDPWMELAGIYSHLSSAHSAQQDDVAFTRAQVWRFRQLLQDWAMEGDRVPWRHLANSAAALAFHEGTAPPLNMVRAGIAIYGYPDVSCNPPLGVVPAARVWTQVAAIRCLPQGWPVGYERGYVTQAPVHAAILTAGYGDGLQPGLKRVSISDREVPLLGKLGMDTVAADVSGLAGVRRGDQAVFFGPGVNGLGPRVCPLLVPVLLSARRRWVVRPR